MTATDVFDVFVVPLICHFFIAFVACREFCIFHQKMHNYFILVLLALKIVKAHNFFMLRSGFLEQAKITTSFL